MIYCILQMLSVYKERGKHLKLNLYTLKSQMLKVLVQL